MPLAGEATSPSPSVGTCLQMTWRCPYRVALVPQPPACRSPAWGSRERRKEGGKGSSLDLSSTFWPASHWADPCLCSGCWLRQQQWLRQAGPHLRTRSLLASQGACTWPLACGGGRGWDVCGSQAGGGILRCLPSSPLLKLPEGPGTPPLGDGRSGGGTLSHIQPGCPLACPWVTFPSHWASMTRERRPFLSTSEGPGLVLAGWVGGVGGSPRSGPRNHAHLELRVG